MTASGTAGHGDELEPYFPLRELGAVVVKSLSADPWPGNPSPRVHPTAAGMLNSVGLEGPGVDAWLSDDLPRLVSVGATVVVSIWGERVADFARAAAPLAGVTGLAAVEVNVSCPNLDEGRHMFAHSATATAEVVEAVGRACPEPAPVGEVEPHGPRHRRHRPRRQSGQGPRRSRSSTPCRPWSSTWNGAVPCWGRAPEGEACRDRPSTRWPCGPSTTCGPPSPKSASSGWAG